MSDTFVSLFSPMLSLDNFIYLFVAARIFWGFDGNLEDLYSHFNGIGSNSPSYVSPGYNGAGSCVWLNRSLSQFVTISSPPFLNMTNTSFTFETWIYAQSFCNVSPCIDNALLGQFQGAIVDRALHLNVRNQRTYFGFYSDDAPGNQVSE